MINLRICSILIVIAFTVISCKEKTPEKVTLNIIQTTDVHGAIFPFDFVNKRAVDYSLAHVHSLVKEARSVNPNGVILLDNGDLLQGQPSVYYYNFEDTSSTHLAAQVLNYLEYDAAVVGNHDIETGHDVYERFREELNAPYLAANTETNTGKPYFEPYTIIEKQGIKVAVLGLVTPGIPKWLPEKMWKGMQFTDMIETAKKWMDVIKTKEKPDLIIGLFHAGVDHMYENPSGETYLNENATRLVAEQVPGFDIVLAGHDHQNVNEHIVNVNGDTVLLIDPMSHARAVAFATVNFTYDKKLKKYAKRIHGEVKRTNSYEPDEEFMATFTPQYHALEKYINQQIGVFESTIDSKWSYFGNSAFVDFVHQVQLLNTNANVSFTAPLHFRSEINKGPIYLSDLFKLYKYENLLYTIKLTGAEIDGFLEYSISQWFNTMVSNTDHLLKLKQDENENFRLENQYFNFSSASGIDYLVDVSKPDGDKVRILGFTNEERFYADSMYTVALNSYRGVGGGGHLKIGCGLSDEDIQKRFVNSTEKDIRMLIKEYIESQQVLNPEKKSNWRIIPEDYYEFGKKKDMRLLFGN